MRHKRNVMGCVDCFGEWLQEKCVCVCVCVCVCERERGRERERGICEYFKTIA